MLRVTVNVDVPGHSDMAVVDAETLSVLQDHTMVDVFLLEVRSMLLSG